MGYLLHPKVEDHIRSRTTPPRILDLGTGTGIWAVEAARAYPSAIITGLDIADNQFPPPGTLPKQLTFSRYSFFEPVPAEFVGQFDVVHISFITAALFRGGRDTVIKHITEFLKPGGYLQWREIINEPNLVIDPVTLQKDPSPLKSMAYAEKWTGYMKAQAWTKDMPQVLAEVGGFEQTEMVVPPLQPELLNLETQLLLWNSHEFLNALPKAIGSEEAFAESKEAIEDTEARVKDGKMLHWQFMVGIGRKPE